jgi:pilus assembly protein CpaB
MVSARPLNKRSTTILITTILAVGTGVLAFNYLTSVTKVARTIPMRTVVVAAHEIPVRTIITPAMLTVVQRPADGVEPDAIADMSAVTGQIALITIPNGATMSASKVGHIGLGGLPVRIPKGQRAVSIPIDRVKGVADLVAAGDHVDVIAEIPPHGEGSSAHVITILRNIVVLAMGSTMEAPTGANASPAPESSFDTATLAVTPEDAGKLFLADTNATLRLTLRSEKDTKGKFTGDPFVLPAVQAPRAGTAAAPASGAAAPAPAKSAAPVHLGPPIIDGDRLVNS